MAGVILVRVRCGADSGRCGRVSAEVRADGDGTVCIDGHQVHQVISLGSRWRPAALTFHCPRHELPGATVPWGTLAAAVRRAEATGHAETVIAG